MVKLDALSKRFGDTTAVAGLSLEVGAGEMMTLLGPSGCGKTTTLRMIAGFETPTQGQVFLDGRDVTLLPPQRRGVGMVFQNYALFPHLDVAGNVAFGLEVRGVSAEEKHRRVARALEMVDLSRFADRHVQELSGGQQQRVAVARALAPEPPVLLLDEPLSNLDPALRERTREELRTLLERLEVTTIFVTHDQDEAFALSDRVALMNDGRLQQLGTPEVLYTRPANAFVASFLGRANFLSGRVTDCRPGAALCELEGGARWLALTTSSVPAGAAVRVMVRPEALVMTRDTDAQAAGTGGTEARGTDTRATDAHGADARQAGAHGEEGYPWLHATIVRRRFAGAVTQYWVRTEAGAELLLSLGDPNAGEVGERVRLGPRSGVGVVAFPAQD